MIRIRFAAVLVGALLLVLLGAGVATAVPAGWTFTQVTSSSDGSNHSEPRVSGNRIAWINGNGPGSVWTWKVGDSSPTLVSGDDNAVGQQSVSGDRIVWRRDLEGR
jgi:hypothetical protein